MPGTIVTLVLFVIALSLGAVNFYLYLLAKNRKANAFFSAASLNALLRALHREAATAERKDDVEFAGLIVRFEAARIEAQAALDSGSNREVIRIVDAVGSELDQFRQARELK